MKRTYPGIDILKYIFACLIPLLHITIGGTVPALLQQYLARLGVPFFFAASGFFLARSMEKRGPREAMLRHVKRVGKLFLVWLLIYSPMIYMTLTDDPRPLARLLFQTPCYLWYLGALLLAGIPFCLIRNRKLLWGLSAGLYLFGTLFSGSWSWLTGGFPAYTDLFLTTRNGLFFGLPMLCVGELAGRVPSKSPKRERIPLILSVAALFAEICFVRGRVSDQTDTSMYFLLPVCTFWLLRGSMCLPTDRRTDGLRNAGVAIYVMQYGMITVMNKLGPMLGLSGSLLGWMTWFAVVIGGTVCGILFVKNKFLKHLFQ